ncbi:ammonia-forming cytochrome c nitrite reductase subunit c552 [Prolixibacteraceae bacterium Z1-6]|uniref:Ammonia-forming cytochrome c nitrite reductase subunit c552 n=1 Tax=Draconibacterium aestuarii TaxID=2998507 RepID=A0A9X3J5H1_9BACT|nr:ammonia-forming cytochrome c nitrite reductase subunit c552 [Prolixibacteraceae bacterium Z1-6]
MRRRLFKLAVGCFVLLGMFSCKPRGPQQTVENEFSGSESCRECHEKFYQLWETSYHGQAMMPVNADFVAKHNLPGSKPIDVEGKMYEMVSSDSTMTLLEKEDDKLVNSYQMIWAMGGHNVYTFLTPLEKGKLQTAPLAFDANRNEWFNYPEAGVRMFDAGVDPDEALPWKDAMFTFNTGCYSCHISQLSTNFDLTSETYHTTWREAGINCETCHGPAGEHIRIFKNLKEGEEAKELGLISTKVFTQEQHNASCSPCHAKMSPITPSYMPGDKFFDNYNITTLEDRDFYPDGRDLGENYTLTGWMMNKCVQKSELHCVTCHTSSGRDRNKENPNQACLTCHNNRNEDLEAHTGHPAKAGLTCVSCHMPKREFVGHFLRSDHSFRPPMPEATIKFGSPNACNQCHTDKTPEWANEIVKKRPNGNYQEETLKWAQLIKEARDNDWSNIDKIYSYIKSGKPDEVVTTSFIRLLGNCNLESKYPVLLEAINSESELVRSAAAIGLSGNASEEVKNALLKACQDEIRLVRIQAVNTILTLDPARFNGEQQTIIANAEKEYVASMTSRLDNWSNHYNLGIYHQNKGEAQAALSSYETAARLYPESIMPLINSSVLYSYVGNHAKAEENLKKVLEFDPKNEAANLNLGLLLAEQGRLDEAEVALQAALERNPENNPVAAKNLSVIVAQRGDLAGAVKYAAIGAKARPKDPNYAYTLAYYQMQNGQKAESVKTLNELIKTHPQFLSATSFLADIYLQDGNKNKAILLYKNALKTEGISAQDKAAIQQTITTLQQGM